MEAMAQPAPFKENKLCESAVSHRDETDEEQLRTFDCFKLAALGSVRKPPMQYFPVARLALPLHSSLEFVLRKVVLNVQESGNPQFEQLVKPQIIP